MKWMLSAALGLTFMAVAASAQAQTLIPLQPVEDPEKFSQDVMTAISEKSAADVAKMLFDKTGGQPETLSNIANGMKILEGKNLSFRRKIIDKQIEGTLRQIGYYVPIDSIGFVYFRFNFKLATSGWILANFKFIQEAQELLPKDFYEQ